MTPDGRNILCISCAALNTDAQSLTLRLLQSATADLRLCLGSGQPLGFDYQQVVRKVVVYHGDQVSRAACRRTHLLIKLFLSVLLTNLRCRICARACCGLTWTCGSQDTLVPLAAARWLTEQLKDCSLDLLPNATHQMYLLGDVLTRVCKELSTDRVAY